MPAWVPALILLVPIELMPVHKTGDRLDGLAGLVIGCARDHGSSVVQVERCEYQSYAHTRNKSQNLASAHRISPMFGRTGL